MLALLVLAVPLTAQAADGVEASAGGGAVAAVTRAAEVIRRKRAGDRVSKGTRADAARFGWSEERAAYEASVARWASKRRKRKVN